MTQKRYGYVIVNSRSGKWLSLDERWTKSLKSAIILKSPDNLEGFATNASTPIKEFPEGKCLGQKVEIIYSQNIPVKANIIKNVPIYPHSDANVNHRELLINLCLTLQDYPLSEFAEDRISKEVSIDKLFESYLENLTPAVWSWWERKKVKVQINRAKIREKALKKLTAEEQETLGLVRKRSKYGNDEN